MELLKKIAVALLVAVLLVVAWDRARRSMADDDQQIRWQLEGMVDGFHSQTLRHVMRGFHSDYRDASSRYDREDVQRALIAMFFEDRGSSGPGFPYRLEIPEAELVIEVDEADGDRARVTLRAVFYRRRPAGEEVWWDARATLSFVRERGKWRILESSEVNHGDRRERR